MLDYSVNLAQIKVEKVTGEGGGYFLRVSPVGLDVTHKVNLNGTLVVKTDDPDQPVVNIPVYIIVS